MGVKKIKAYDIEKMIDEMNLTDENEKKMQTHIQHKLAIIEGEKGILTFCEEGVGQILDNLAEEFEISLSPKEENAIHIFPTHSLNMSLNEIKQKAECQKVEIKDFIRKFGQRHENNFNIQLDAIEKIGLKKEEYYSDGR
ncbi:hypothetical protein ACEU2D_18210 [Brevibacillus laterosporus]|uniref:hypothetical protein n=1 Tax=Brevibacillus laterosporus TaxID=1465 RepID=UPI0035A5A94E